MKMYAVGLSFTNGGELFHCRSKMVFPLMLELFKSTARNTP